MWDLSTNKANFLFKNMQDFNQTIHVGPQDPNVFTDNISFYFYAIISINNLMKQSRNSMSWLFQHSLKNFQVLRLNTRFKMQNACFSTRSFSTWIVKQFQNGRMQWFMTHSEPQKYVSISFYFNFYFTNCMQNYSTMSTEHSGKKLLVTTEDILHKLHLKFWISEACGLQISKFLIFSCDEIVVDCNGESDR